ncbi:hypothetical protein OEZ86_012404 [Tetradesmus obliquus]|nr:hypothetical protein OEZ86_012404 [Tetradesmus obliquus]
MKGPAGRFQAVQGQRACLHSVGRPCQAPAVSSQRSRSRPLHVLAVSQVDKPGSSGSSSSSSGASGPKSGSSPPSVSTKATAAPSAPSTSSRDAAGSPMPPAPGSNPPGPISTAGQAGAGAGVPSSSLTASGAPRQFGGPRAATLPAKPSMLSEKSRVQAVAAKISAARELARRLAEEKQAAVAAAKADADSDRLKRSTEEAAAQAAAQAARADMLARQLKRVEGARSSSAGSLSRLRRENDALKNLLLELAADRQAAQSRLAELQERMAELASTSSLMGEDPLASLVFDAPVVVEEPPAAAPAVPETPAAAAAAPQAPPLVSVEDMEQSKMAAAAAAVQAEADRAEAVAVAETKAAEAAAEAIADAVAAMQDKAAGKAVAAPTSAQLAKYAADAAARGEPLFSWPPEGVGVGGTARVYYNRCMGPLPSNGRLQLKAGLNKWESIVLFDMQRCSMLANAPPGQEWYEAEFELPAELFKFDFVIMDQQTGGVDNNRARDFSLTLIGGPTEQQLMEQRAAEYAAAEAHRRALLAAAEVALWEKVQLMAAEAAAEARIAFKERRTKELMAAATKAVQQRRRPALATLETANAVPGVYGWVGSPLKAGARCILAYNCRSGPLAFTNSAKLHLGYDGWYNKEKQTYDMNPLDKAECEKYGLKASEASWCAAVVDIPASAAVVDFVISDRDGRMWDNNANKDFHSSVEAAATDSSMVEMVFQAMKREAAETDSAAEDRAASRAMRRVESKAHVLKRRRENQQEFLYTLPVTPKAGQPLELFYNPDLTPLRGRPEIYVRGSFNRWRHGQRIPPIKMESSMPGGIGFLKATIDVPEDAAVLDVVFADSADSQSFHDDNGGLDYHIPIEGGRGVVPGLKVVHVAVEMAPIAKVGGMGDVVTALARAVQEEGHTVEVVVPKYDIISYHQVEGLYQDGGFNHGGTFVRVWRGTVEGLATTFLEPENGHFWRQCIYGRGDDHVRFAFFCSAANEYMRVRNVQPDILHCHDWQSAPVSWGERPNNAKVAFTIHNLNYGADLVGRAMATCEVATTVSPTYAREISGHPVIAPHLTKMFGIRNGIDQELWDPSIDEHLPLNYGPEDVVQGKAAAKRELRRRGNLADVDVPLVSVVTRLVHQKGIHLIKHAAWRTLERGGQFVLLGSAPDPRVQGEFNALRDSLMRAYPDRAALFFSYDEPLSHLIYAASDMFLVPSMFEPCGLTQMIAMRYGTITVVRKTGGLADTVFDLDHDEERALDAGLHPNGFSFEGTDTAGMDYALNRALGMFYSDRQSWNELASAVMQQDWSWDSPALDYLELYYKALKG